MQLHGKGALVVSKLASRNFMGCKVAWMPLTLLNFGKKEKEKDAEMMGSLGPGGGSKEYIKANDGRGVRLGP